MNEPTRTSIGCLIVVVASLCLGNTMLLWFGLHTVYCFFADPGIPPTVSSVTWATVAIVVGLCLFAACGSTALEAIGRVRSNWKQPMLLFAGAILGEVLLVLLGVLAVNAEIEGMLDRVGRSEGAVQRQTSEGYIYGAFVCGVPMILLLPSCLALLLLFIWRRRASVE